ncbi:MAG: Trehalose-phosphate synthase [Syntrophus sp. PtaU1.Bin005]|nr:MAG: Trehalose-phosphate synthase [Syntrophus sp. PtaU1.Bin005]
MKPRFPEDARLSGRGDRFRGGLIVASNREPYCHRKTPEGLRWEIPVGGVVSALDTVLRVTGGTWVAWGSGSGDMEQTDAGGRLLVPPENPAYTLRRIWLSASAEENYYHGFCNLVLWPLFHGETDRVVYLPSFWEEYEKTNRAFAEAILEECAWNSTIWIHDYHLCRVPRMIRAADQERIIAHFWHIPWPERERYDCAPHGEEILAGLLGNDLLGFQTPLYARNFMDCAAARLGAVIDDDAMTVAWDGRTTQIRTFPISTDFECFNALANSASTAARIRRIRKQHHLPRRVGLAVDRLDYTKGILQRLQALELFFQRNPEFHRRFSFIQVAVMTRSGKPYLRYRQEVEDQIAEINEKFGKADWRPIIYFGSKLERQDLVSWYRMADVAVITPLHDGMNLVAKEYVASRGDGKGVLILGRQAGAAEELTESILVDPTDIEMFATAIHRALTLSSGEKKKRMMQLRGQVQGNTIYSWVGNILDELSLLPVMKQGGKHALTHEDEIAGRLAGRDLFFCLDFDGTLAPIVEQPELAAMPDDISLLLSVLQEHHPVALISGRRLDDIRHRVGLPGLVYAGNHGMETDNGVADVGGRAALDAFLPAARQALECLPGIEIEDKGLTVSIHFRKIAPVLLEHFFDLFQEIARKFMGKIVVNEGRKVFEILPQGAPDKGSAVRQLLKEVGKGRLPVYMGDDTNDEEAFRAVREDGITVAVGGSTEAEFYLRNQGEVGKFLALLIRVSLPDGKQRHAKDEGA